MSMSKYLSQHPSVVKVRRSLTNVRGLQSIDLGARVACWGWSRSVEMESQIPFDRTANEYTAHAALQVIVHG